MGVIIVIIIIITHNPQAVFVRRIPIATLAGPRPKSISTWFRRTGGISLGKLSYLPRLTGSSIMRIYRKGGFNLPLWKMMEWKSVGMILPNIWKNKNHVPNHQPVTVYHTEKGPFSFNEVVNQLLTARAHSCSFTFNTSKTIRHPFLSRNKTILRISLEISG